MTNSDERARRWTGAGSGRRTRREAIRVGAGLGLALGGGGRVLDAAAQAASPTSMASPAVTAEEIARAIAAEGTVAVANWAYQADPQIVAQFQKHIHARYGVDVRLNYETSLAPPESYAAVAQTVKAGAPPPYDVMAIEEKFLARALAEQPPLAQPFLPSALIPNAERVDAQLRQAPRAVAFQASSTIGIISNRSTIDFLHDWTDLADPRLKGKLALPSPDNTYVAPILFVGLSFALGKDQRDLGQMKQVIDFAVDKIAPNASSFDDNVEPLFASGAAEVVLADSSSARVWQARGEGEATFLTAASGQPMINGWLWMPVGAAHPILARLFIDWRLSDDGQLPGAAWGLTQEAWLEYHEGLLGPSYAAAIPDWLKSDSGQKWWARSAYDERYPTPQRLREAYKAVDWVAYNRDVDAWMSYYATRLAK